VEAETGSMVLPLHMSKSGAWTPVSGEDNYYHPTDQDMVTISRSSTALIQGTPEPNIGDVH